MVNALETYLEELASLRGAATKETPGYPALASLLNFVGHSLKPRVRCFVHPRNSGSGLPDGGFFTPDQLRNTNEEQPLLGVPLPSRGVVEVKAVSDELDQVAKTEQAADYLEHYGLLLLTNYREFRLFKSSKGGKPVPLESFRLAADETSFWQAAAHPRKTAGQIGERFFEYLKRVLLHNAPLNNPKEVAFFLASYARDARVRVEAARHLPALQAVRAALEEALGMKFEADKGEHFFRSTLVQTLFYGVFSAWVLWHKENPVRKNDFDWRTAAWTLHVPMIKALFEQVATPTKLGPLGLVECLDWTAAALNRVERNEFFARFVEEHAVQYFYEPFLEAFDPELRKELGVWYTPPEIVKYQVARVDAALREELDIPDGLADPRVFVLDPCCGTGAYLVEVLHWIEKTLKENKGEDALVVAEIKEAAQKRVFGFEIMPAPFVVAHLQMGLLLQNLAVPLDDSKNERAGIYLTNSLTGWEPPSEEAKKQLSFPIPEFKQEKEAADGIKQEKKIIVILGNPPYNGFAGVAVDEERDLTNAYRSTKRAPAPQGQGLNDLYVRFFRMAERRIVEKSGEGVISFISNYSWLDGLSFTGMREKYLEVFDSVTVDCLNGDKFKTGKLTPEGRPDPSVFSTEFNREGIQVGTAIATLVKRGAQASGLRLSASRRKPGEDKRREADSGAAPESARGTRALPKEIHFRHLWGKEKRAELLNTLDDVPQKIYMRLKPPLEMGLPFLPAKTEDGYFQWPLLKEMFPVSFPGVQTKQDALLTDIGRANLEKRMRLYFDAEISNEEIKKLVPGSMDGTDACEPKSTRAYLVKRGFKPEFIVRYAFRPFDYRWLYWEPETKLLGRKVPEYFPHVFTGNLALVSQQKPRREWNPPQIIAALGCLDLMDRSATCFPLYLRQNLNSGVSSLRETPDLFSPRDDGGGGKKENSISPNLSDVAAAYSAGLKVKPDTLFFHTLAVLHSPAYRVENGGALRQDWPRVPLPKLREALLLSAKLGNRVATLLDTETPVAGVTAGKIRPDLVKIAVVTRLTNDTLNLSLTAGWGHAGQNGVTMPGKGKLETRGYTAEELEGGAGGPLPADPAHAHERRARSDAPCHEWLGQSTHDIFLNDSTCWRNVPERVWDYTIGGYQVIKKWLSYREFDLLGRALTPDEAREVTHTARRIAALILLQPELDRNYVAVKSAPVMWSDFSVLSDQSGK